MSNLYSCGVCYRSADLDKNSRIDFNEFLRLFHTHLLDLPRLLRYIKMRPLVSRARTAGGGVEGSRICDWVGLLGRAVAALGWMIGFRGGAGAQKGLGVVQRFKGSANNMQEWCMFSLSGGSHENCQWGSQLPMRLESPLHPRVAELLLHRPTSEPRM